MKIFVVKIDFLEKSFHFNTVFMEKYALTYVVFNNVACPGTTYDSGMSVGLEYY